MKIALVAPATITEFEPQAIATSAVRELAEHVPLGVLTIAAVLRDNGLEPLFVDLNALYQRHVRERTRSSFPAVVASRLEELDADVVGFGTLSSSYPLTLRIATALKAARPQTTILLGGPQASVVDQATLSDFPAVDFVLRGEADDSIVPFVEALHGRRALAAVPGLSLRRQGQPVQVPPGPVPVDLDALPSPAYDLFSALLEVDVIPLEVGRGCPYGCTFCSTNTFFRRRFRLKSPPRLIDQMRELNARYDCDRFNFVHDMLTVVREDVVALCNALTDAGSPFTWTCSARTDRVDDDLLEHMFVAGCRGIFFGIETGSPRLQRTVKKRLDLVRAQERIAAAARRGLRVVVSLITGFPEEGERDLGETVDVFVRALRHRNVSPQLHLLAPLAGSPIHEQYRQVLHFDDVLSDMSHSGWTQDADDRQLIRTHPDVFPNFYAVPTSLDRRRLKELRLFLIAAAEGFRWLLLALHRRTHALALFDGFRANGAPATVPATDLGAYYTSARFRRDFLGYVRTSHGGQSSAIDTLIAVYEAALAASASSVPPEHSERNGPRRRPGVAVVNVALDIASVIAALTDDTDPDLVPIRGAVAVRRSSGGPPDLLALPPLAADVLRLCDGRHSAREIAARLDGAEVDALGLPPADLLKIVLENLVSAGLVGADAGQAPQLRDVR